MLKKRNTESEPQRTILTINDGTDISRREDVLRIRRERVNEAIEIVGYDPVKIEQYLSRKHVA